MYVLCLKHTVIHIMDVKCGVLIHHMLTEYIHHGMLVYVELILHLPHTTHKWILGPLLGQAHINVQLYKRCARFLHGMKHSLIHIWVLDHATPLRHYILYFSNKYGIDSMHSSLDNCITVIRTPILSVYYVGNIA